MRLWPACLALILAPPSLGVAQSTLEIVEIVDGRRDEPSADPSEWAAHPALRQAAEGARAHWRARDPGYEEDFRVLAVAEGAFTQPGAQQQAVLFAMSFWPRCCPKTGLAIVEGGRLLRNVAFEGIAQELSAVPDLDGDGRDELVSIGGFGMGGESSRGFALLVFEGDGLVHKGGASIYEDACAAGRSGTTAARVLAHPGPEFLVERFTRPTCETQTWEPVGGPEPLQLEAPAGGPYVELPVR